MATSSSSIGDSDEDHTLSYIIPEIHAPRQRGTRGRSRGRGRGRAARRAPANRQPRGGQRGRRVQRGQIRFAEGEADRLRVLQEQRKRKANDMIDSLTEEGSKKILKALAEKMPSIILDVAEELSAETSQPPPEQPGPSSPEVIPPATKKGKGVTQGKRGKAKERSDLAQHHGKPGKGKDDPGPDHQTWPSWCVCQHCREMPSDASRVCCGMRPDLCTSLMPEMDLAITDPHVLQLQQLYRNDIFARHATTVEDINKSQRHAAYRQFILFEHGRLGAHNRRPVPSCCTWFIRDKFPDPYGVYVDYVPVW